MSAEIREHLSDALQSARDIVESAGLDVETRAGAAAFERVLDRILGESSSGSDGPPSLASPAVTGETSAASRIATWIGVSADKLEDLFEFGPDAANVTLWHAQLPPSKADSQRLLSLLKLAVDRVGYERDETPAREINALCEHYGCLDQNLPAHLQNYRNFVSRRGRRGSFTYRITHPGLTEARETIRRFLAEGA